MIYNFILIVFLLIIMWYILLSIKTYNIDTFMSELGKVDFPFVYADDSSLESCQVPTLTTDQCYKSREYECPIVNGTMLQCTNNYIPKPSEYNADCGNRTFEMVPYPWKISENCYYNKIGFNREKKYDKVRYV